MNALESERTDSKLEVSKVEDKLIDLNEKLSGSNNGVALKIEQSNIELKTLLDCLSELENKISTSRNQVIVL